MAEVLQEQANESQPKEEASPVSPGADSAPSINGVKEHEGESTPQDVRGSQSPTTSEPQQTNGGVKPPTKGVRAVTRKPPPTLTRARSDADPEAQAMVIDSLRAQVQDLFSQVSQLNNKLVQSYDRVSDLEDDLHVTSSNFRNSSLKISQLELERTQHLAALNTGLLVEKSHVTTELTRLMEKATEEAARRGQAETARADIEKELDDLSANLFDQANTMVAEARLARAISERKVVEAELALKGAEEAVAMMQEHMQTMQGEKEAAERAAEEMKLTMGKGKWVERSPSKPGHPSSRLLNCHTPYQEFILFVTHLRSIRPATPQPPVMSTFTGLPFFARLSAEDSDPTIRLDLAPSLNWLSRRSVISAIYSGQLTIEPMSTTSILQEFSFPSPTLPGTSSTSTIACALCGTCILPPTPDLTSMNGLPKPPSHPLSSLTMSRSTNGIQSTKSWSGFLTKTTSLTSYASTPQTSVPSSPPPSPPTQVYVFRVSTPPATNSLPPPTLSANPIRTTHSQIYPLCKSGWCLSRLRTTCSLWSFVRTGIVEKIWEEELPREPVVNKVKEKEVVEANKKEDGVVAPADGEKADAKPPVPPRRRGLWERASSIASTALGMEKEKEKEKKLPLTPPPTHPSLPPHVDPKSADPGPQLPAAAPPPLPKRSQIRERERTRSTMGTPTEEIPALNGSTSEIGSPRPSTDEKPTIHVNGLTGHGQDDSTDHGPSAMSSLPSTLSESTSQEHFSTPTEEFASLPSTPFATSPTPTPAPPSVAESTPLPSSVPSTPTPDDTFAKAIQNSSPARTASPAPPPVPRRAAARARPLSISTPRSGTPVPESVQESVPAPAPSEPSKPEVDVFTMADVQPVQDQDEASVDNKTITQSTKEETPTLTESAAISEAKPSEDGSDNGSSDSEASSLEMYVGTATWEERSWKEITRLREDMFWARIGCVR